MDGQFTTNIVKYQTCLKRVAASRGAEHQREFQCNSECQNLFFREEVGNRKHTNHQHENIVKNANN